MNQIILNGISLPQTSFDKYACWEENLSQQVDMISGRRVIETRGTVWKVLYSYDCMDEDLLRRALAVLRGGAPFIATVLPDNSDETVTTSFVAESVTNPFFLIDDGARPVWHGFGFTLREERPHD